MTSTYAQLQKKIAMLQRQADMLRDKEVAGVIDRIKVAIAHYGLTAQQLGFEPAARRSGSGAAAQRTAPQKSQRKPRRPSTMLYRDDAGHSWTGRGPQPRWLKEALARGKTLGDLAG